MKKHMGNNKGYLLPMTAIFIIIMVILGMSILYLGGLEKIGAGRRLNREKAFYLAEAGVYRAYAHLKDDISWEPEEESVSLGEGSFLVVLEEGEDDDINIVSTGTVNGRDEMVKLIVEESGGGVFGDGIFGNTIVKMTGSSQIYGYDSRNGSVQDAYVGSNLEINLDWSTRINGDAGVATGGDIIWPAKGESWEPDVITGDEEYDNEERILSPVVIPPELLGMGYTQTGASGLSGNYKILSNNFTAASWPRVAAISAGDYKFNKFTLDSDAQFTLSGAVRLYFTGNINLSGNCRFILSPGATVEIYLGENSNFSIANSIKMNYDGIPANLAIYSASTNTVNLAGTGDARINAVVYAPMGKAVVANSTQFKGGIVTKELSITGNARVYYDIALAELTVPGDPGGGGTGGLNIKRWTKPGWASRFQ